MDQVTAEMVRFQAFLDDFDYGDDEDDATRLAEQQRRLAEAESRLTTEYVHLLPT